ncbi:uncharacterized protein [Clytia hemisphaerica]|uniref:uncharacterized protein n=1 Tax=Clytia hemisphaerica TaxID=252671 RepID=UPI0034D418FF
MGDVVTTATSPTVVFPDGIPEFPNGSPFLQPNTNNSQANVLPPVPTRVITQIRNEEEKLLSNKQHGFINCRSNYLDVCTEDIANGKAIDAVYFDFAKAFDPVPRQRLLIKLEAYGIRNKLLNGSDTS